jgi:hypothetical protein
MRGIKKIRQYRPDLLWYIQRCVKGVRGAAVSVYARDVCGVDKRCAHALRRLMMSLVEEGLATQRRRGVYLIEKRAAEEALTALKQWT